jgi:flagellar basal-body rod protein FlgF
MRGNYYVSLSAIVALDKRMETVSTNLANVNTGGYRADGVSFASVLSKAGEKPASFVTPGAGYIDRSNGAIQRTDNPLDVAIQGDGWFGIQTPSGIAYTRDGRFQVTANGQLQTINGYPVLDAGGAPMLLTTDGSRPSISSDGMITQGGQQVGAIGLFSIPDDAKLSRYDNSAVRPDQPATPILDFSNNGLQQGFAEGSNVNPVLEITKLIEIQRAFEGLSNLIQTSDNTQQDAIKTLGASTS